MKKIIIKILLVISIFSFANISFINNTYATECNTADTIIVKVSEAIPGVCCDGDNDKGYECHVEKGFGSVTSMLGNIIKYFTFIAGLAGVLFIVINGILYSMGGMEQSMKDESKKRIVGTLIGLILLLLSGVILNMIAPWIYKGG